MTDYSVYQFYTNICTAGGARIPPWSRTPPRPQNCLNRRPRLPTINAAGNPEPGPIVFAAGNVKGYGAAGKLRVHPPRSMDATPNQNARAVALGAGLPALRRAALGNGANGQPCR
jgi:hypothetical protein